jgi:hypothetical protein
VGAVALQPNSECHLFLDDETCQLDVKLGELAVLSFANFGRQVVPIHHLLVVAVSHSHCQAVIRRSFFSLTAHRLDCEELHVPIEASEFENGAKLQCH